MNVLVDGRTFTKKSAGISTFLKCSLQEWANKSPQNNFWVFVPKKKDAVSYTHLTLPTIA